MTTLVHPKQFAQGLDNAVVFSTDKAGLEVSDSVWASWTGETFRFMGRGRYSAMVYDLAPSAESKDSPWSVILSLDTAKEVSAALKKVDGAGRKDSTIDVIGLSETSAALTSGADTLAHLEDAPGAEDLRSTEEFEGFYEKLETISEMPAEPVPPVSPIVFTKGVITKLSKLKADVPSRDEDRWELHHIGGATWVYRYHGERCAAVVMLESCRDNLE